MPRLVVGSDREVASAHARELASRNAYVDCVAVGVDAALRLCNSYDIIYIDDVIAGDFHRRLGALGMKHTGAVIEYSARRIDGVL